MEYRAAAGRHGRIRPGRRTAEAARDHRYRPVHVWHPLAGGHIMPRTYTRRRASGRSARLRAS